MISHGVCVLPINVPSCLRLSVFHSEKQKALQINLKMLVPLCIHVWYIIQLHSLVHSASQIRVLFSMKVGEARN